MYKLYYDILYVYRAFYTYIIIRYMYYILLFCDDLYIYVCVHCTYIEYFRTHLSKSRVCVHSFEVENINLSEVCLNYRKRKLDQTVH